MADDQSEFDKQQDAAMLAGTKDRLENSPPIGMKSDGTLNIRKADEPDTTTYKVAYPDGTWHFFAPNGEEIVPIDAAENTEWTRVPDDDGVTEQHDD